MVVVDEDMTKLNAGAPPRERWLGEGQSLAAEPMDDAAGEKPWVTRKTRRARARWGPTM